MGKGPLLVEVLSKVFFQYGPFALSLLLLYKGHSAAKKNKDDALAQSDKLERRLAQGIYIVLWVAVFAFSSFSIYVWYRINVQTPAVFLGEFTNLESGDVVEFRPTDIYQREDTIANRKKVQWTYVSLVPIPDKLVVELVVQRASRGGIAAPGKTLLFRFDLDRSALNKLVRVYYHGSKDNITVQVDGQDEKLELKPILVGV